LIEQLEARLEANLAVARSMLKTATADPLVKGSRGQLRPHPGFGIAKAADEVALRMAAEIRLSRRQVPDDPRSEFDELDAMVEDLAARRRARGEGG
jgi:hypothetical protein